MNMYFLLIQFLAKTSSIVLQMNELFEIVHFFALTGTSRISSERLTNCRSCVLKETKQNLLPFLLLLQRIDATEKRIDAVEY